MPRLRFQEIGGLRPAVLRGSRQVTQLEIIPPVQGELLHADRLNERTEFIRLRLEQWRRTARFNGNALRTGAEFQCDVLCRVLSHRHPEIGN